MSLENELDEPRFARWAFETKQIHAGRMPDTATTSPKDGSSDEHRREEKKASL